MYITKRGTILDHAIADWFNNLNTEGSIYNVKSLKKDSYYHDSKGSIFKLNLAGVDKKNIEIYLEDEKTIVVNYEEKVEKLELVGSHNDLNNIEAEYNNGLLTISIPKKQKEKRVINIK